MYGLHTRHVKLRRPTQVLLAFLILILLLLGLPNVHFADDHSLNPNLQHDTPSPEPEVALVIARRKADDTTWLMNQRPDWRKVFYTVDDPEAELTVPRNKGREAMVYLTYIINNYDTLKPVTIFVHAERYQWHNDDPDYDGQRVLSRLNISHVKAQGYANLRCAWVLGCPSEIRPFFAEQQAAQHGSPPADPPSAGDLYKPSFEQLFPGVPVPEVVGSTCCAQFAVAADAIRTRSKADYEKYRQWILETELEDAISGRIFEYSWHMIFGKEPVFCQNARYCYENLYGMRDLQCYEEGACEGRYDLPPFSSLPNGWPEIGWDGGPRTVTEG